MSWYRNSVKVLNKKWLNNREDTVWRNNLGVNCDTNPVWRVLYKPPLKKRVADLQWRILHGAVAVNTFISVINRAVVNKCPFCGLIETVFHVFKECDRLSGLFSLLTAVFRRFDEQFSVTKFIFGAGYRKTNKMKW